MIALGVLSVIISIIVLLFSIYRYGEVDYGWLSDPQEIGSVRIAITLGIILLIIGIILIVFGYMKTRDHDKSSRNSLNTKRCLNCGYILLKSEKFCPNCGQECNMLK